MSSLKRKNGLNKPFLQTGRRGRTRTCNILLLERSGLPVNRRAHNILKLKSQKRRLLHRPPPFVKGGGLLAMTEDLLFRFFMQDMLAAMAAIFF